ncbi:MAG: hypothetical protein R2788_01570 [Saprospiraceae bacterium]
MPPAGIGFDLQAKIDDFVANYPGCINILGDVEIEEDAVGDIIDLTGLSQVQSIGGDMVVYDNISLVDFDGLQNLAGHRWQL